MLADAGLLFLEHIGTNINRLTCFHLVAVCRREGFVGRLPDTETQREYSLKLIEKKTSWLLHICLTEVKKLESYFFKKHFSSLFVWKETVLRWIKNLRDMFTHSVPKEITIGTRTSDSPAVNPSWKHFFMKSSRSFLETFPMGRKMSEMQWVTAPAAYVVPGWRAEGQLPGLLWDILSVWNP